MRASSFRICFIIPREPPSPMKSVFFSGTAMPSKKCYHSSSESWHMICRRNPPTPCLAPRCFSTIIVRNHLLLVTAILPVSSRCLTPCALAVLASVIIFHALLPSSASAGTTLINIEHAHQVQACHFLPSAVLAYRPKPMSICISLLHFLPMGRLFFHLCHATLTNFFLSYLLNEL